MREIPMPPDRRPIAQQAALDAARNDDGLRVRLVQAIWRDGDLPTAAAQTGGFVYEIADRVARAVEERERDLRDEQEHTAGHLSEAKRMIDDTLWRMHQLRSWAYRDTSGDVQHNVLSVITNVWDILDPDRTRGPVADARPDDPEEIRRLAQATTEETNDEL